MGITATDAADMLDALSAATPHDVTFSSLASRVRGGDKLLFKDDGPEHITASYLVLDPALDHVLLQFHSKGQFWVQFGGHLERTDPSFLGAAVRELVSWSRRSLWTSTSKVWATGSATAGLTSICSSQGGPTAVLAPG